MFYIYIWASPVAQQYRIHLHAGGTGDMGLIPGSGRSPGEGNGNPLQYSCLGNPKDRGAWWAIQSMWFQRVGHDLMTEHQQQQVYYSFSAYWYKRFLFTY